MTLVQAWSKPALSLAASSLVRRCNAGVRWDLPIGQVFLFNYAKSFIPIPVLEVILQYFTAALIVTMPKEGLTSSMRLMRVESFVSSTRAFCMASSDSVTLNDTMRLLMWFASFCPQQWGQTFSQCLDACRIKTIVQVSPKSACHMPDVGQCFSCVFESIACVLEIGLFLLSLKQIVHIPVLKMQHFGTLSCLPKFGNLVCFFVFCKVIYLDGRGFTAHSQR